MNTKKKVLTKDIVSAYMKADLSTTAHAQPNRFDVINRRHLCMWITMNHNSYRPSNYWGSDPLLQRNKSRPKCRVHVVTQNSLTSDQPAQPLPERKLEIGKPALCLVAFLQVDQSLRCLGQLLLYQLLFKCQLLHDLCKTTDHSVNSREEAAKFSDS